MTQPPPIPQQIAPVIPYATPQSFEAGVIQRSKNQLVVPTQCVLPPVCVKCNQPAHPKFTWRKKLYWHPSAIYILILFPGILIYAIVAMAIRKSCKIEAGLCEFHGRRRRKRILIAWLIALAGAALIAAAIYLGSLRFQGDSAGPITLAILGIVTILASLIWSLFTVRVLRPMRIEKDYAWLGGAGDTFLDSFPPM